MTVLTTALSSPSSPPTPSLFLTCSSPQSFHSPHSHPFTSTPSLSLVARQHTPLSPALSFYLLLCHSLLLSPLLLPCYTLYLNFPTPYRPSFSHHLYSHPSRHLFFPSLSFIHYPPSHPSFIFTLTQSPFPAIHPAPVTLTLSLSPTRSPFHSLSFPCLHPSPSAGRLI